MKKRMLIIILIELLLLFLYYYLVLPPINVQSMEFWAFIFFALGIFVVLTSLIYFGGNVQKVQKVSTIKDVSYLLIIPIASIAFIIIAILFINIILSPMFNSKSYANRISVDRSEEFIKDIKEVDFNKIPLLDRDSSEKLGDRVMGKMSEYVSQYYVSNQYTQINYNDDIIRVTPLEYADIIKWFSNRKNGTKGYITVNSVNGKSELVKLDKGMKYMPSAYFNEKLARKLRFKYPTKIFGDYKFEIDNEGNPYWIVPVLGYTGVELKEKVTGVILFNPIDGESKLYDVKDIPSWVDNAFPADLLIDQIDNWGEYNGGFLNSIFGQKNVTNTTRGYNYLAMNGDIYLYTGITSVLADESNLGFVLSNLRTSETTYYSVAGAEEYSAMSSAEGQVQQMNYKSTFPLLINLNGKPTYLVSLKDAAGLVKKYAFIDVEDYQKVSVSDSSKGIEKAAQNYLSEFYSGIKNDLLIEKEIIVNKITSAIINGNTYYYVTSGDNKYKISIALSDNLPFVQNGDKLKINYYESTANVINVEKLS